MTEVPDYIQRAIEAQGKTTVEAVAEALPDIDLDTIPGPAPTLVEEPKPTAEQMDFGGTLCPECKGTRRVPVNKSRPGEDRRCPRCTTSDAVTAPRFEYGRNGWLSVPVWPEDIERAKARHDEVSARARGYYVTEDRAWAGFLFEETVASWLTEEGVAHSQHGGLDTLPDFEIGGQSVGARCRVYRPDPLTILTWPQKQKFPQHILFGVYDARGERIYIAGAISAEDFVRAARVVAAGSEIAPRFPAHVDVYVTDTSALGDAATWLQAMRG